jgi:hypothetical protein
MQKARKPSYILSPKLDDMQEAKKCRDRFNMHASDSVLEQHGPLYPKCKKQQLKTITLGPTCCPQLQW